MATQSWFQMLVGWALNWFALFTQSTGKIEQERDDWKKAAEILAKERDAANLPPPTDDEIRQRMREGNF